MAFVVAGTLVSAVPASAEEDVPYNYKAAREWTAWKVAEGTPSIARAATEALMGTDEDIRAFEQGGGADEAQAADNRAAAEALASMDGPAVKAAATAALAGTPEDVEAFISGGFQAAWISDERLRVYRVMEGAGPTTKAAAQAALNGTAEDVSNFLDEKQEKSEFADDRLAATRMLTGGVNSSGPILDAAAAKALAGSAADLRYFLVRGQFVARARDAEMASIAKLTQQAKEAGETTSREALAASDAARRAQNSAEAARKAAQEAAVEAKAAGGAAKKASAAAGRAADAAEGAAKAAKEAKGAASAAMRAASVAEDAARRATTAASLTAQAAANAHSAAAAARSDKNKASDARKAAEKARDAAAASLELERTRVERDRAMAQAQEAVNAAKSASTNADAAATAADEASGQAGVSAEQAKRARDAAAKARREAAAAARAAERALTFAKAAAKASDQAFQFAADAAAHATAAAAAAEDAAAHAGDASKAAAESAKHAQAAVASADLATRAANQAVDLEKLAREQDALRLTEATEQGIEESQEAAAVQQAHIAAGGELVAWNRELLWDTEEEDRVDPSTRALLNAATAPGASAEVVRDNGRRAALALMQTGGQWSRQAAQDAIAGTDVELQAWLSHGRLAAVGQDNRARLWSLIDKLAAGAEKTAAQTAVSGDDAAVQKFLRTRSYAGKIAKDRAAVYAIQATAGPNLKAAADRALAGTSADQHQFLRTGQYPARAADERIEAYRVMEAGGPEVKATAQVALAGPPSYISYFLTTSRYQAAQRDNEQASHVAAIGKLILEAQGYAEKARADANEALKVAALARKAEAEAINYANQAAASRTKAENYAQQAAASAAAAKKSADAAAQSAAEAQQAAASAKASADKAARSAAVATAAADRAASDAAGARQAAADAKADAAAAGKDAEAAQAAADDAVLIYNEQLAAYEEQRRSEEAGSGSDGTGTANNDHRTWSCLLPDQMSEECVQVYVSFADALIRPQQCSAVTARDSDTGCEMLGDIMDFAKDNPDLLLDALQFVLMACGVVPGAGEACDAIDAGVSLARGDYAGAALSGVAMLPFAGYVGTFFKGKRMSGKFRKAMDVFEELAEKCDNVPNVPGVAKFGNSFVPGTPVLLANGRRKPIEQVRVGDQVMASDPATGRTGARSVTATVGGAIGTKRLVDITVDTDGDAGTGTAVISATAHHSFWAPQLRAWVSATALTTGMTVQNAEGDLIEVERVERRTITGAAFNLTVDGFHSYYVGAGAQSVLVHNCGKIDLDDGVAQAHPKSHVGEMDDDDMLELAKKKKGQKHSLLDPKEAQAAVDYALNNKRIKARIEAIVKSGAHPRGYTEAMEVVDVKKTIGKVADASTGKVENATKIKLVIKKIKNGTDGHDGAWVIYTLEIE
ncbi:polymorphic toxin-type HINT domain-containing protein [Actinoplanes sp. CA-252034]|uniref:polymorphic toxin-type HINT domain-containing protein n=1 Tax=Actinoplanes sp. CA-252034 TaxID=3239906 RepID=UPI003D9831FD